MSGSKLPDIQAGIESALSILAAQSHGVSVGLGLGSLESGATGSFEMVVVADEVIGFVRRLAESDGVSPAALFDSRDYPAWIEAGRPNMIRSARDRAIEIVGSDRTTSVPASIVEELRGIAATVGGGRAPTS
jgi:trimethylamine:corrinoid methyltransferase-like protein